MGAALPTPEKRTLESLLELTRQHDDLDHLRQALAQLDQCRAPLQECDCVQFVALFERLNTLVNKHGKQLANDDRMRLTRFALLGKAIAPTLAQHLLSVEEWGSNLPALAHLMIHCLFVDDLHPDVQRDLLVAHMERGYQAFYLGCDLHWSDAARYDRLVDQCEAVTGKDYNHMRHGTKPKP